MKSKQVEVPDDFFETKEKYPWNLWTNGATHVISEEDLTIKIESFIVYLYNAAKERGMKVHYKIVPPAWGEEWKEIFFKFYNPDHDPGRFTKVDEDPFAEPDPHNEKDPHGRR